MNASTAPTAEGRRRRRRATTDDLRARLLEAALTEFSENGYTGASTRRIAARAGAHQPQINYHFESKEALWRATVDLLMAELDAATEGIAADDPREAVADFIRRFVRFAAARPELQQIMIQEGTADSDRLRWIVDEHLRPRHQALVEVWDELVAEGRARPMRPEHLHYMLVGAITMVYANAPEARLLNGVDPTDPALVEAHADAVVALFLPELDR